MLEGDDRPRRMAKRKDPMLPPRGRACAGVGGGGGAVGFGRHPARGPTVSRCAGIPAWGAKEAPGLPYTWPLHMGAARVVVRPRVWYAPGIDPAISRVLSAYPTSGPTATVCVWGGGGLWAPGFRPVPALDAAVTASGRSGPASPPELHPIRVPPAPPVPPGASSATSAASGSTGAVWASTTSGSKRRPRSGTSGSASAAATSTKACGRCASWHP